MSAPDGLVRIQSPVDPNKSITVLAEDFDESIMTPFIDVADSVEEVEAFEASEDVEEAEDEDEGGFGFPPFSRSTS